FDRPFMVVDADPFANALDEAITATAEKALPRHLGGIDQFVDSTYAPVSRELRGAIRTWMGDGSPRRRGGRGSLVLYLRTLFAASLHGERRRQAAAVRKE